MATHSPIPGPAPRDGHPLRSLVAIFDDLRARSLACRTKKNATPAAVHELRRAALRAITATDFLPPSLKGVRKSARLIRRVRKCAAPVREADVAMLMLDDLAATTPRRHHAMIKLAREHTSLLRDEAAREMRRELRDCDLSPLRAIRSLLHAREDAPLNHDLRSRAASYLGSRMSTAMALCAAGWTSLDDSHDVRRALRRWRQAVNISRGLGVPPPDHRLMEWVDEAIEHLGGARDLDMLRTILSGEAPGPSRDYLVNTVRRAMARHIAIARKLAPRIAAR